MSSDNYSLFGEPSTANTLAPSEADTVSLFEPTSTLNTRSLFDPVKSLEERKAEKLAHLGQKSQYSNLSDSYTELENGIIESNANKIWNELSGAEFSSIWDYASNNLALGQDENGYYNLSTGARYEGPVRRAYGYGTKADDTTYKFGLSRGDRDSSDSRYTDYAVGPEGVDISKKRHDILLPDYIAQTIEALGHGRKEALAGRAVPDRLDLENYDRFGGGATEYYKSKEAFFGDPTSETYGTAFTPEQAKSVLYNYATQPYVSSPFYKGGYSDEDFKTAHYERLAQQAQRREADNADFGDRLVNGAKAFGRTLTKEVGVDFADWIGEGLNKITGGKIGWDVGTEQEKTQMVNNLFGFNPYAAEDEYKEAKALATNIVEGVLDDNKEVNYSDVYELVKLGVTTPELFGDSLGFIGSFFVPFLGWGGKAAKADKAIRTTQALLKAGKITKEVAKTQVAAAKAEVNILNKMRKYTQANAGLMQVAAGNVNDQIDAYKAKHGEGPSVGKVAQMMVTETLLLGLDRWSGLSILKAPAALKGVREAFSALGREGKTKILGKTVGVALGLTANAGKEAGQEYLQEIGQEFNVQFNFDDNGAFFSAETLDEAKEVFLAKDMQILGVTGAGLGAGGALQFASMGGLRRVPGAIGGLVKAAKSAVNTRTTSTTTSLTDINEESTIPTEDEVKTAKQQYAELLTNVTNTVAIDGVTADNLGKLLDDLDEINNTKHVISDSSPEQIAQGESYYNTVVDSLEKFIRENPEALLTSKQVVRKPLKEAVEDKKVAEQLAAMPEEIKSSMQTLASVLTDGEQKSIEKSLQIVSRVFNDSKFEEVVQEEETLAPYLQQLEQALLGKTSETVADTFSNIQTYVKDNKLTDIASKVKVESTPTDTILGSTPSSDERVDYTDYTRSVDAERVVDILLGSGRQYDDEFKSKLYTFARKNGIKESTLNNIIKSYAAVEEEATVGNRGYRPRLSRLKGLAESSNPDKKAIDREFIDIVRMQSSLIASVQNLKAGILKAQRRAEELNKRPTLNDKAELIKTDYLKINKQPFGIYVSKNEATGKWEADITEAQKRLALKDEYVNSIQSELTSLAPRLAKVSDTVFEGFSGYTVPEVSGRGSKIREKDANNINKVKERLEKLGVPSTITKVILGENTSRKWTPKGDYYKANSLIINNDSFTDNDVVLVNSTGVKKVSKTFNRPELAVSEKADPETMTDAQRSFEAAVNAGATIVLDSEMSDKTNTAAREALAIYLNNKGYELIDNYYGKVFVKGTEQNKAALEAQKKEAAEEKAAKEAKDNTLNELVSLARAIKLGVNPKTGEALSDTAKTNTKKQMDKLADEVLEDFKGDKIKLVQYVYRRVKEDVSNIVTEILTDPEPVPFTSDDKVLEQAVQAALLEEIAKDEKGVEGLAEWKKAVEEDELTGKDKKEKIKAILAKLGSTPKVLVQQIFGERSFSTGQKDMYELRFMETATGKIYKKPVQRKAPTKAEMEAYNQNTTPEGKALIFNGKKHVFLGVRKVVQDPKKLLNLKDTTVLNSVPFDMLPFALRDLANRFNAKSRAALAKVSDAELSGDTGTIVNGDFLDGNHNLYNSPARGIIFNKEGKTNPEVLAAMYLAVGDMFNTDMLKLIRGYKTDADIAQMFGLQEFEVTQEMRSFVKEHGAFSKTVANTLGKTVLRQLGLSKKESDETSSTEYEYLVADLGNAVILLAEKEGLLEAIPVKSNELARMFKDSNYMEGDAQTYFIHAKDKDVTVNGRKRKEPVAAVTKVAKEFETLAKKFPEARPNRKEPFFKAPTAERIKNALTKIRNDILGLDIPANAQDTLKQLMNTAHRYDSARVDEFLAALENTDYKVKELLGWVDLESDKFKNMTPKSKETQEAKNRDIERGIEELQKLKERIEAAGKVDPELFFDYFYAGNNRYMLDSNTVNPQTDKVIRFLIVPALHKMTYNVTKSANNGFLFYVKGSDQSYTVRLAIAQGLGKGVDKLNPAKVIAFSDAVLSMSAKQRKEAKVALLTDGEYVLRTREGIKHKLEAEHITHALQTMDFLEKLHSGVDKTGKGSFESSLSLEFDSLTSGFANKVQQMPILSDMDMHFARTGILTEAFQKQLMGDPKFIEIFGEEGFDPAKGHSIADILDAGSEIGFYDSYQNLAKFTIDKLKTGEVQSKNLTSNPAGKVSGASVFEALKPLLPGGEFMDKDSVIDKIGGLIRNLFKDPFMIFNYSASIDRIVTNLGIKVANDLADIIATTEFLKEPKNDEEKVKFDGLKQTVENFLKSAVIYDPESSKEKSITTAAQLQKALRNHELKHIMIKPFAVSPLKSEQSKATNLEELLENVVKLTYGEVVKSVFEEQFKPFIEVQNAMNDTFKIAFRIFDKKRMDKLSALRRTKDNHTLTVADHAQVLEELWDDFPWIVGPLSGAKDKDGISKAIIAVSTTSTRTPNAIEMDREKTQSPLGTGYPKAKTRKVTPIVKYLEEAVSAGSVLPFHAIDGAEMSFALQELQMPAVLAIHDAIIAPLDQSDNIGFSYQKGMQKINSDYVLADAMQGLVDRIRATVDSKTFSGDFKEVSVKNLKTINPKEGDLFPAAAEKVVAEMEKQIKIINDAREKYYGDNGLLKGAWYGNLVGMGMYQVGMTEVDRSYNEVLKDMYSTVDLDFKEEVSDNTTIKQTDSQIELFAQADLFDNLKGC